MPTMFIKTQHMVPRISLNAKNGEKRAYEYMEEKIYLNYLCGRIHSPAIEKWKDVYLAFLSWPPLMKRQESDGHWIYKARQSVTCLENAKQQRQAEATGICNLPGSSAALEKDWGKTGEYSHFRKDKADKRNTSRLILAPEAGEWLAAAWLLPQTMPGNIVSLYISRHRLSSAGAGDWLYASPNKAGHVFYLEMPNDTSDTPEWNGSPGWFCVPGWWAQCRVI